MSSFVRNRGTQAAAGGVCKAGNNGTRLLSTGLADLDKLLGGGIPLGKLVIVMEDTDAPHHLLLLRYFMAQGLTHAQKLLFGSSLATPNAFLSTLPQRNNTISNTIQRGGGGGGLRIAWQYDKYDQVSNDTSTKDSSYVSTYDLRRAGTATSTGVECFSFQDAKVECLLKRTRDFITTLSSFGRIAIHSLCAPNCMDSCSEWALLSFMLHLKALLYNANAVALVTVPAKLLTASFSKRWQHLADILLSVEALPEEEPSKSFLDNRETVGLLHVHKLSSPNTQVPAVPESVSYAMKIYKKRELVLEQLHLAPVAGASACGLAVEY